MSELFTAGGLVALVTLTVLELVLSVDNIIFLAIVSQGVDRERRSLVQKLGLSLALLGRTGMVLGVAWLLTLDRPFLTVSRYAFSAKDLILLAGGLFLTSKAVNEIYRTTELKETGSAKPKKPMHSFLGAVLQVTVVDMVFAVDSVLTAIGLTKIYAAIIIAMGIAIAAMMFLARPLSDFIEEHPSLKMLALAFLVMIGVLLQADAFGEEINRNYVYFAILFSLTVEGLNFRREKNIKRQQANGG